jgi:hypothetical protein
MRHLPQPSYTHGIYICKLNTLHTCCAYKFRLFRLFDHGFACSCDYGGLERLADYSELPRRLALWFPREHLFQDLLAKIPAMVACLVRVSPYVRMCVLKSFLHAWTTSHRAREYLLLTRIFGCSNAPDAMKHYFC